MPYLATVRSVAEVKKEGGDCDSWYRLVVSPNMGLVSWARREGLVPRLCVCLRRGCVLLGVLDDLWNESVTLHL